MKKLYIAMLFCMLLSSHCFGKDLIITLKDEPAILGELNFYIEDIIDSRKNKENIGTAMTGAFNVNSNVKLDGGFREALLIYLNNALPKSDDKMPIVLNVLEFNVREKFAFFGEVAEARASIELYLKEDNRYNKIHKAEVFVKQRSGIDCTKFHEPNIKKIIKDSLLSFVNPLSESVDIKQETEVLTKEDIINKSKAEIEEKKTEDSREPYYFKDWKKTANYGVMHGNGLLFEYRYEKAMGHYDNHTNLYSIGIGGYKTLSSKINVKYSDGVTRTGKIDVTAIPISYCLYRLVRTGAWRGKWGIGFEGYYYTGNIDMSPYPGPYKGSGLGANLILPFEGVFGVPYLSRKNNIFLRFNYVVHIPLLKSRFENANRYIETPAYAGSFFGVSIGKHWN